MKAVYISLWNTFTFRIYLKKFKSSWRCDNCKPAYDMEIDVCILKNRSCTNCFVDLGNIEGCEQELLFLDNATDCIEKHSQKREKEIIVESSKFFYSRTHLCYLTNT